MTMSKTMALGCVLAWTMLVASNAALAEREASEAPDRYVEQVADLACVDGDLAWQTQMCDGAKMRWSLCALGLNAAPFISPEIYQCFVRSQ